ncbi:hypothetical protein OG365_40700 (plasmid) [Streptomyces sp. NBC_00853]|uniref:hypothetical protein n=1 Tax=Streptomyces sp. NBC_00853 TaxID=2903681 RepID=UPI002F90AD54|nr:hypothetical protein OG365_40700 [Streptomyces sp. NBC_00853]
MLEQAFAALAAAGGTAVVTAAGTEAWTGLRQAVARWFGRDEVQRENAELERLDRTASALQTTEPGEVDRARLRQEVLWQARIETFLESLDGAERDLAADELRALVAQHSHQGQAGVSAGPAGLAAGGNVEIHAEGNGSMAAGVIHGGVQMGTPTVPDPSQG